MSMLDNSSFIYNIIYIEPVHAYRNVGSIFDSDYPFIINLQETSEDAFLPFD